MKTYKLGSVEFLTELKAALERLVSQEKDIRPFVIVEDVITKRFIQFAGSFNRPILIDVPWRATMEEKNQNVMNLMMAAVLLDEPKPPNEFGVCFFQKYCPTVGEMMQVAQYVLRDALELPEGIADLTITEDNQRRSGQLAS